MSRKNDSAADPYRVAGIRVPETCPVCGADLPEGDRIASGLVGQEWRDHIPSGYEDQAGYGQVSCSCGWLSDDRKLGWEEHIDAAERMGRAEES